MRQIKRKYLSLWNCIMKNKNEGLGAVAQVVKVLALHAWDPIWAPVLSRQPRFPSSSLPVARESFGTLHPRGRPGRGSWLQIGIASAVALTWGVNHQTEDLPLCLSLFSVYPPFQ